MKKTISLLLSAALVLSLAACGGGKTQDETLTGTAKGYGGDVTVTLTRADGKITACTIEGKDETEAIGGAALETLAEQVKTANGYNIDGVSGATITSEAVKTAVAAALGETYEKPQVAVPTPAPKDDVKIEGGIQLGLAYGAAHGTKCFSQAYAVVRGDTIVAAHIDEYQFMAGKGVPNSDQTEGFAAGYADPAKPLVSKRVNNAAYSKNMAERGGATVALATNYDIIQNFTVGKTIAEVEAVAAQDNAVDAVSGATLADTAGYLKLIAQAARNAQNEASAEFKGTSSDLTLNVTLGAAHGTKCFSVAAAVTQGDKILLSYLDEFQFMAGEGVPNSDQADGFAAGYADAAKPLVSKRVNNEAYSKNMAERGGATVMLADNYDAIQKHVNGMTIAEAEALSKDEKAVDAVSGATLADTAGYVGLIVDAAKGGSGLRLGLAYGAAHGTKCFSQAYAVVRGDTVVAAHIDEYQFMAGGEGVPNSDQAEGFAAGYADAAKPLVSKRVNNELYSKNMAEKGGATVKLADNYDAIQAFAVGKTITEIESAAAQENVVDAVSGATLADTAGYLKLIAQAARNAQSCAAVEYAGDMGKLELKVAVGAAHGTKCFSVAAALTDGETIVLSYLDEFQFMAGEGVPNSDVADGFAAGYADAAKPLVSKRVNNEAYSKNMAERGGATVMLADNYDAIQKHVNGMTIAEAEALSKDEKAVDAVSGATLADTAGYVGLIVKAAKG